MDKKLHTQLENALWDGVPELVIKIARQTLPISMTVRELSVDLPIPGPTQRVWYNPEKRAAYISFPPRTKVAEVVEWHNALKSVSGIDTVNSCVDKDAQPPDFNREPWVLVKRALYVDEVVGPVTQALGWKKGPLTNWMGGPNTLASTLASGLLGTGLGYGLGWLGEQFLPEEHFEPKKLRRTGAILGGLGLGLPSLWWGLRGGFGKHLPFQPDQIPQPEEQVREPQLGREVRASAKLNWQQVRRDLQFWLKEASVKEGQFGAIGGLLAQQIGQLPGDPAPGFAGAAFLPRLPVDAFNRLVQEDPFTPPNIRAATTGLTTAAGISANSPFISPTDIARIGVGMGSGWLSGMVVGKALGALAGLKPESQKTLQRAGMWAGFLNNVVPIVFQ